MFSALEKQIDGSHYKSMVVQPIELAYYVRGTPAFCKLAKYLTREKGDKIVNLNKALHCIELERQLSPYAIYYEINRNNIDVAEYWINRFTTCLKLREALLYLYRRNYERAMEVVGNILAEEEESKSN